MRPALASCSRTPPDSASSTTASGRSRRARCEQADELGAMHFADAAAHELAFLRGDEDHASVEQCTADGDAVVEGHGHAELREVRACHPLGGR